MTSTAHAIPNITYNILNLICIIGKGPSRDPRLPGNSQERSGELSESCRVYNYNKTYDDKYNI